MKRWIQIGIVIVAVVAGFVYYNRSSGAGYMRNKIQASEIADKRETEEEIIVLIGNRSCPACKEFQPVLEQAMKETGSEVYYMDTNNSKNHHFLKENNITATPTLLVMKKGSIERVEGSISLEDTKDVLLGHYLY